MKKTFKPRARLLLQLGDQLIKNENIAVVELVKNSYDADAKMCQVILRNIDSKENSEIIIQDDGVGMTPEIVEQIWLEPGADFKDLVLQKQLPLELEYRAKRTPIGEKGIGRFGVHKLGDSILMITKSKDSDMEVVVSIDWKKFKTTKYLKDADFDIELRSPEFFTGKKTGTYIQINDVRVPWSKNLYESLSRTIISLSSPFADKSKEDFFAELILDIKDKDKENDWEKKVVSIDEIKKNALWHVRCTLAGDKITKFRYEFLPYSTMDKLKKKVITEKDDIFTKYYNKLRGQDNALINLSDYKIGEVNIDIYLYYLGSKILKYGLVDRPVLMNFLTDNGGVRVYREGMRIYNYGEPEDDWLGLDQKRISNVGGSIGNKLILGTVSLDRKTSFDLVEKTNREGFVEDGAYKVFKESILQVIGILNHLRNIDKDRIKEIYEGVSKGQPVLYDIDLLKDVMEEKFADAVQDLSEEKKNKLSILEKEINTSLDTIKKQYIRTHETLIKAAGAGLSFGVVVHEIEKRVRELSKIIENFAIENLDRVSNSVASIQKLLDSYSVLINNETKKTVNINKVIEDAIFNCSFRFKAHQVEVLENYKNSKNIIIKCVPNIVIGSLLNVFDNSLHWLNAYEVKEKKILVDVVDYGEEVGILIADNGKGFLIKPEDAIKPFISMKIGGTGLGLHIVDEIMKTHEGRLVIRDFKETNNLPKEFSEGAILELIFKK